MADELTEYLKDDLNGSYDCVDRLVINAYNPLCHAPAGFRFWWRQLMNSSDADLDNSHLMRLAGRFSRRVRGYAKAHDIPVIDCQRGERKHEIAEEYLAEHAVSVGVFLILVSRSMTMVYDVERSAKGVLRNLTRKKAYVNHYSFHIIDPSWGHVAIKMAGHPPFDAQVMLNGHEYVERTAKAAGLDFSKEGNCFTSISNAAGLAMVADTLSESRTAGHLIQVCERWIYSACLSFVLDSEEQQRSQFRYHYSIYQVEYSRNLLFCVGGRMDRFFQALVDRGRSRLDPRQVKTLFGTTRRPRYRPRQKAPRCEVVIERPSYDLTIFKIHFGKLTLKASTKGEHVLRFEAIADHAAALHCGRVIERFPAMVASLKAILERFLATLHCVDRTFLPDELLDQLPLPSRVGQTRVGGVDTNTPRMRATMAGVVALASSPRGFTVSELVAAVHAVSELGPASYGLRQAAYDLRKLRGKELLIRLPRSHRYEASPAALRSLAALLVLRDQIIKPLLAAAASPKRHRRPTHYSTLDQHYDALRTGMRCVFADLGIAA